MSTAVSGSLQDSRASMTMKFGCCCGDNTDYGPCFECGEVVADPVCCVQLTSSRWVRSLLLTSTDTYEIGDSCASSNGQTSLCGELKTRHWGNCLQNASLKWHVSEDCTEVVMTLTVNRVDISNYEGSPPTKVNLFSHPVVIVTQSVATNWHTGPVTFTSGGETYTVEVCTVYTEDWMTTYRTPKIYLQGWRDGDICFKSSMMEGTRLCGIGCVGTDNNLSGSSWRYNMDDDSVYLLIPHNRLYARGSACNPDHEPADALYPFGGTGGHAVMPFDDGDWYLGIPDTDGFTFSVKDSCADGDPDPGPCSAYACFPECLVKFCDPDVNANALFLDVTSLNGCCLNGSYEFTWGSGTNSYYSGKIGDQFLVTCGYVEIWYECSGATFLRRVKVTDVNGGVSETTQACPRACSGTPENFVDSFDVPSSFLKPLCFNLPPFYSDTVTFDVYTNN